MLPQPQIEIFPKMIEKHFLKRSKNRFQPKLITILINYYQASRSQIFLEGILTPTTCNQPTYHMTTRKST